MKAILYTTYGPPDVLHLQEVPKPTPADNEVLLKVHATSINAADAHIVRGEPFLVRFMLGGVFKPKYTIPGSDVAGRVEAVGRNVTRFQVGDEVFGDLSASKWGAFAEYVCANEAALLLKPATISFEQAAAVPLAGVTALQGLRTLGKVQAGQKVLINGAAGGVGTYAVQIAKALGAEVTGVTRTEKMDLVRSIGAEHVIDYKQEDITAKGQQYDLILDNGAFRSFLDYRKILTPTGTYIMVGGSTSRLFQTMLQAPLVSKMGSQTFTTLLANANIEDLAFLKELLEAGKITPAIDRCYPLAELPEAIRYFEEGHTLGKIVVSVAPS